MKDSKQVPGLSYNRIWFVSLWNVLYLGTVFFQVIVFKDIIHDWVLFVFCHGGTTFIYRGLLPFVECHWKVTWWMGVLFTCNAWCKSKFWVRRSAAQSCQLPLQDEHSCVACYRPLDVLVDEDGFCPHRGAEEVKAWLLRWEPGLNFSSKSSSSGSLFIVWPYSSYRKITLFTELSLVTHHMRQLTNLVLVRTFFLNHWLCVVRAASPQWGSFVFRQPADLYSHQPSQWKMINGIF